MVAPTNEQQKKDVGTNPQTETFFSFPFSFPPFLHNLNVIAGAIIGGIVAGTGIIGFVGAIAPIKRKDCLVAFIVLLIAVILAELGLGGVIWFKTLRMRSTFQDQWTNLWADSLKVAFQDMVRIHDIDSSLLFLCCFNLFLFTAI